MSYQSFKRVLGETNLERKCRFLFGACLLVLITTSFYYYGRQTESVVYESNQITGRLLVDTHLTRVHWENVKTSSDDQLLARWLGERLQNTPHPASFLKPQEVDLPTWKGDDYERQLIDQFRDQQGDQSRARRVRSNQEYHYYQPVRATDQSCIDCHNTLPGQRFQQGDLMAVAKVVIDDGPTQRRLNWNSAILISTAIVTTFLAMVAAYVIVRYVIAKPLNHLKDVAELISRGNIDRRAEIATGDEFEELAHAFNRMLRHLVTIQEEHQQANMDLDAKVDQLAKANLTLYEMNRLKSDFLATMSHELRTPLNSILGFSEVLATIPVLDDKQKRYVHNIQKSGKILLDMINDILDLAKIESGKMEVRLVEFRMEHVVGAQCDLVRPLAEKKNIDLLTEFDPSLPPLRQDQGKIQQILANLLSNAVKFTPEGGRIQIRVQRMPRETFELIVADTGVGIAEEDQEIIFEKFRQGHTVLPTGNAMTREYSGTGLGLSIVKELCRLLGGEVRLQSELGKGSTFTVRLPLALSEDDVRQDAPRPDPLLEFTKPGRPASLARRSAAALPVTATADSAPAPVLEAREG